MNKPKHVPTRFYIGLIAFGVWGLALGINSLYSAYPGLLNHDGTRRWAVVEGQIVSAEIDESRVGRPKESRPYKALFTFQFIHRGKNHTARGYKRGFGWDNDSSVDFHTRAEAQAELDRRPVGSRVTVYVNPLDPAKSVLMPDDGSTTRGGAIGGAWVFAFFSLIGITLVIAGAIALHRKTRRIRARSHPQQKTSPGVLLRIGNTIAMTLAMTIGGVMFVLLPLTIFGLITTGKGYAGLLFTMMFMHPIFIGAAVFSAMDQFRGPIARQLFVGILADVIAMAVIKLVWVVTGHSYVMMEGGLPWIFVVFALMFPPIIVANKNKP